MAKQKGIIHFVGTISGVNFYYRKGVPVARKAGGGFNGDAIKKKPSMVRVRENNTEFGTTSSAKKLFKDRLFPFFGKTKDSVLHGKMMQLFIQIKDCDTFSERGKRSVSKGIQTTEGKKLLEQFEFTSLSLPISNGVFDELTSRFMVSDFSVKQLKFPKGASHFKLELGIVKIDFEEKNSSMLVSSPLFIAKDSTITSLQLETDVPESYDGNTIAVLAYRYVQDTNGSYYDLKDKVAYGLKVLKVN